MQRTLYACPKLMIGGRIARNRSEGACQNDENIQALDVGFYWKVLNWMQFHQNAHLKLVVLQQMTHTQSSNKSLGLFCSSATTSYISLPFICDQTKPLFILWSSPETHPNIASLYLPPSVCLAGSLTQSFNYSTKLYWASPKYHTLRCWKWRGPLLGLLSPTLPPASIYWYKRDSVNCFNSLQIILWSTNPLYSNDSILRTLSQVKNKKTAHVFVCCWFSFFKYQITPTVRTLAVPGQLTILVSDNWGGAGFE